MLDSTIGSELDTSRCSKGARDYEMISNSSTESQVENALFGRIVKRLAIP